MEKLPLTDWHQIFYDTYLEWFTSGSEEGEKRIKYLQPVFDKWLGRPINTVLDVACGAGLFAFALEKMNLEVTGVDNQDRLLSICLEHAKHISSRANFDHCDIRGLPYESHSFDAVVFLGNSITEFDINELSKIFSEIARVLKKEGIFLVSYMDWITILNRNYDRWHLEGGTQDQIVSYHVHLDTSNGIIKRLYHNLSKGDSWFMNYHIHPPWVMHFILSTFGLTLEETGCTEAPGLDSNYAVYRKIKHKL